MIVDGERKLAYITSIQEILPIPNADKIELARVGGWQVIVAKNDNFQVGDKVVYIEIDSRVPSDMECFAFLADRKYKVKSIKLRGQVSQGLIMPLSILPVGAYNYGDDVTKILRITKIEDETKEPIPSEEMRLKQRHKRLSRNKYFKFMMKYEWFRKLAFKFLLPKKKAKNWPAWIVKTDEERVQNMTWILQNKDKFEVTEKLDGTSSTYSLHKEGRNWKFYVCSRNVLQDTPDKKCFHNDMGVEGNVYWEMAEKYNIEAALRLIAERSGAEEYVTLQGETIGEGIQGNKYGLKNRELYMFNLIIDGLKYTTEGAIAVLNVIGLTDINWVPLIDREYVLPDTMEELMEYSTGKSMLADTLREGYVFRRMEDRLSFKCVSNEFLLKHKL